MPCFNLHLPFRKAPQQFASSRLGLGINVYLQAAFFFAVQTFRILSVHAENEEYLDSHDPEWIRVCSKISLKPST